MNVAVILAGGVGNRLGASIPKQYIEVMGKPIIVYTLEKFEASPEIDAIEVICDTSWADFVWKMGEKHHIKKLKWISQSGNTCQNSICNGVFSLKSELAASDILMLHMSISPLISEETIHRGIRTCAEKGNAFALQPCLFCLCKKENNEWSEQNAYKEDYVGLNMPWVMHYGDIYSLYRNALQSGDGMGFNDYLPSLLYKNGMKTWFFEDNDENRLKITTKFDLDLFESFVTFVNKRGKKDWGNM